MGNPYFSAKMISVPAEAFDFLRELRENNNREWFNNEKPRFKILENRMKVFYDEVARLMNRHDDLESHRAYRIYRDIHFSKDKTPFKRYFAGEFVRRKPALRGGYYIHIEPDEHSFIETGFWGPNKNDLNRVRREWEMDATELRGILKDRHFKKYWGKMIGDSLKSAPTGFDRTHADIGLINHKQWFFHHDFTDKEVLTRDFASKVDRYFQAVRPFLDYMSSVLTTNLNGEPLIL